MKTVFISRNLSTESVFLQKLTSEGFKVYGESLIHFEAIPFDNLPKTDWLFFSSKNAVHFFVEGIQNFRELFSIQKFKIAGIGKATSKALKNAFGRCDFTGDGKPENVAKAFLAVAENQTVLFPGAKNSRRSIQEILKDQIEAVDLEIYNNQPRTGFELRDFDVLVFTSPMNVVAYFLNKELFDFQEVIAIGETTGAALTTHGILNYKIAGNPSEIALVKTILKN